MTTTPRPRRSVLYMPGANQRAMEKARDLPADAVILDLEDAVAPDAKALARESVMANVTAGGFGRREIVIRVNGIDTPWFADDLAAAAKAGPDAVLIPKVSDGASLMQIAEKLPSKIDLWAMMETPRAMLDAYAIASATPRLTVLVMGTNDLLKELTARSLPGRGPLLTGIGLCILAARAAGCAIVDGVYNDIKDTAGFEAECAAGRDMGFDGKTLIHPAQVDAANRIFAPSAEEIVQARRLIEAFEAAKAEGKGVVQIDGKMVEALHVDNARRVLAFSDAIGSGQ